MYVRMYVYDIIVTPTCTQHAHLLTLMYDTKYIAICVCFQLRIAGEYSSVQF